MLPIMGTPLFQGYLENMWHNKSLSKYENEWEYTSRSHCPQLGHVRKDPGKHVTEWQEDCNNLYFYTGSQRNRLITGETVGRRPLPTPVESLIIM